MGRFIWKALRHSVRLHLLIPLALFVLSEFLLARYMEQTPITREWVVHAFLPRLGVVYATFVTVVALC